MKIAVCVDNPIGYEMLDFMLSNKHPIEFICSVNNDTYHSINKKNYKTILLKLLKKYNVDVVFLLWFPYIISKELIENVNVGFINTHPSLLPYNRGKHPYFWSMIDNTPHGVSMHFITENIDDGDILFQKEIRHDISYTGKELYEICSKEMVNLFKENYENVLDGKYISKKQDLKRGKFHYGKEIDIISNIDLEKKYKARDLINILRARTFGRDKESAYFYDRDKKYNVNIDIWESDE